MPSTVKESSAETTNPTVWTIGHSTRTADEFIQLLTAHEIVNLSEVRSFPGSRRFPHFNREALSESLPRNGIRYYHQPALGGRRRPNPDSRNTAWRNASFRAYADHIETEEFQAGIHRLLNLAGEERTAVMCAEAVWWRCHRSLIADYLKAQGCEVIHIIDERKTESHPFTSAASIVDGRLSYEGLFGA